VELEARGRERRPPVVGDRTPRRRTVTLDDFRFTVGTPGSAEATAFLMECWPSEITPMTGTESARFTFRNSGARSLSVAESRLRASSTSPEMQSRITHSTSWPTSGCRPSMARITRPCSAVMRCRRPSLASDSAASSS
jgi:hypothetical protein